MLTILLAMLPILLIAGLVVVYVAFPHRGHDIPHVPWVGGAMRKGVDRITTITEDDEVFLRR